jgi:hypothetical protein
MAEHSVHIKAEKTTIHLQYNSHATTITVGGNVQYHNNI